MAEKNGKGLDAIVINTSGCGTTVKDYGHMFRNDALAEDAATVSGLAMDVSELLIQLDLPEGADKGLTIAYHAACSLQHGQQIKTHPKTLLKQAGFEVVEPADAHLCCGSAGTYNLMQPEISGELKHRKVKTLEARAPEIIAAFLQAQAAAMISAAVRFLPLGPMQGQAMLIDLQPAILACAERAATATRDDLHSAAWGADIAAMRHETMTTRIFRS